MISKLEKTINYTFSNKQLITTALTHSSYKNEQKSIFQDNERLEFLGDAVLSIIVADYIFKHKKVAEGELTKIRASLVCETALAQFASQISLGSFLLLGKGEEHNGGRERPSIVSDAFEAVIAAIYLDGGMEQASKFVLPFITDLVETATGADLHDYKTQLQEIIQQNPEEKVTYQLVEESGPDHDKEFVVHVLLNSNTIGKGRGKSKKAAEQAAAKEALNLMGIWE